MFKLRAEFTSSKTKIYDASDDGARRLEQCLRNNAGRASRLDDRLG